MADNACFMQQMPHASMKLFEKSTARKVRMYYSFNVYVQTMIFVTTDLWLGIRVYEFLGNRDIWME